MPRKVKGNLRFPLDETYHKRPPIQILPTWGGDVRGGGAVLKLQGRERTHDPVGRFASEAP